MPAYPMTKSPWSLPPMPLEKDDAHDTAPGFDSGYEQSQDSNRYQSSGEVDGESRQDTGTNEMGSTIPPPLVLSSTPLQARSGRWTTVLMVLAAMGLGLAAGYFLGKL
jgi:hypothetical protein